MLADNYSIGKDGKELLLMKKAVWLYLLLLIFEGALRKWVLPFLSAPLLVVRDPLAIYLMYKLWVQGMVPYSRLLTGMLLIGFAGIITAVVLGHGNLFVALFGARIMLIHFPMIFVVAQVLDREDVIAMGRWIAWIALPMTMLIVFQFYSPQSALVNRGVGGVEGAGFSGAMGYFRPSGTFSFTNGIHMFYGLLASYLLFFWFSPGQINRFLLYGATGALLIAVPFSISRSLAFQVMITFVFALFAVARRPENLLRVILGLIVIMAVGGALFSLDFFQTSVDVFMVRFKTASAIEGGVSGTVSDRYFGKMFSALATASDQPFFGYGLGMGTNAGSALLTGSRKFLIAEEEWGRTIGELGAFLGITAILIRLAISAKMAVFSYRELRFGNYLPWMLLGLALTSVTKGQWAQPTSLGFSVMIGGMLIAALKDSQDMESNQLMKEG